MKKEENKALAQKDKDAATTAITQYMKDIAPYEVLSTEEEKELFRRYQDGDENARNLIAMHNQKLIVSIAKPYAGVTNQMELLDLIMEGNIGLSIAIRRFDLSKGYKFSTYATHWIRQSITRAISNDNGTIRIPIHVLDDITKIRRVQIENQTDCEDVAWLVKETGLDEQHIKRAIESKHLNQNMISLDAPLNEEESMNFSEVIPDQNAMDEYMAIENYELIKNVNLILAGYSKRDQEIFKRRFGWGCEPETLQAIGETYGLTRERVRQIEHRIIRDFRKPENKRKFRSFQTSR